MRAHLTFFPVLEEFDALRQWISEQLAEVGAQVDAVYHCPHHAEGTVAEFSVSSGCRNPMPGLLERSLSDWVGSADSSFLVGDSPTDMEAAERAGVQVFIYRGERSLDDFIRDLISLESSE